MSHNEGDQLFLGDTLAKRGKTYFEQKKTTNRAALDKRKQV